MKKPVIIICAIIVALAVAGGVVFLVMTDDIDTPSNAPTSVNGTWAVVVSYNNVVSSTEDAMQIYNQFMTFDGEHVSYTAGETTIDTADYTYNGGSLKLAENDGITFYDGTLTISNKQNNKLPSNLKVERYTDCFMQITDLDSGKGWNLVRVDGTKDNYTKVDTAFLQNAWVVTCKGKTKPNWTLTFYEAKVTLLITGNTSLGSQSSKEFTYTFDATNQIAEITGFGTMRLFRTDDNTLIMVETTTYGTIWQLHND